MEMKPENKALLVQDRKAIEKRLEEILSEHFDIEYAPLVEAMKYAVLDGGKRVRGVLVLAFSRAFAGDEEAALNFACAVELFHAYTLVHDDLPCMDDDDFRRGKPSCHVKFGEATALLAGDALQALAFDVLARETKLCKRQQLDAVRYFSSAAGYYGVVGGQMIDLLSEKKEILFATLERIHRLKTGILIETAVLLGACTTEVGEVDFENARVYGEKLGLSYQIIDDILDCIAEKDVLGKPAGSDLKNDKTTYVKLFGLDRARMLAQEEVASARKYLSALSGDISFLSDFTAYLLEREY